VGSDAAGDDIGGDVVGGVFCGGCGVYVVYVEGAAADGAFEAETEEDESPIRRPKYASIVTKTSTATRSIYRKAS